LPFTNVEDLSTGLAVAADRAIDYGGLLLDVWHMNRDGISTGESFAERAALMRRRFSPPSNVPANAARWALKSCRMKIARGRLMKRLG
jgi:hypothetical protein